MKLVLHGGAANVPDEVLKKAKQDATERSADAVPYDSDISAIDMVEKAVIALELEKKLNAGLGSVIQMDGRIRMDAGISCVDGERVRYGAVIQIENVLTPIAVARKLMDIGYHSIISGDGATAFAREQGFPCESPFTEERLIEYHSVREDIKELNYQNIAEDIDSINVKKLSTVGAVAIDNQGSLAAACSTGGTKYCYPGRVGDTPIFGAGVYCSKHVAVACTGEGDKVLRRLTAKKVEDFYLSCGDLQSATDQAIKDLKETENGYGGIIAVSNDGKYATSHSTHFMASAVRG